MRPEIPHRISPPSAPSQTTQEGIDFFLSERLDSSWEQDKGLLSLPVAPSAESDAQLAAGGDEQRLLRETGSALGGTGWQGREHELALEVM